MWKLNEFYTIYMKKNILTFVALICSVAFFGQDAGISLKIGDKAPELKVVWIKGEPVEAFDNDMLYLVEFWATWCGPCISSMPHLSDIARKYEGKLKIIGVNVWEKGYDKKQYDSFLPVVKEFVSSMGDKMDYLVAMDNNDLHMATSWMQAAGQNGIPASFLIKEGTVKWIGHPHRFEPVLIEVLDGTYDADAAAKKLEEAAIAQQKQMAPFMEMNKAVAEALEHKDYDAALLAIDTAMKVIDPMFINAVKNTKFGVFLEKDHDEAKAFADEWVAKEPYAKTALTLTIVEKEGLPSHFYDFAIATFKEMLENETAVKPMILDKMAKLYFFKGDKSKAVSTIEEAISEARQAIATGQHQGRITSASIAAMEQALANFRK